MVANERRYWFLEVLGRGGFGSVYRAELQGRGGFRKQVAIKMLHPDRASSPEVVRRLRDEARLLAHVSHPGIVKVDGLIRLRGQWAVVMEYVQGVSLCELISLGPVPILCAVQLVQKVAEALDAAHNALDGDRPLKLVHRDVKPSNILLTPDGNVKLVDFGVAMADPDLREARSDELFFGAAEYMAPERWEFQDVPASDIYSLGAVFWELLTGEILGRTTTNLTRHCELVEDAVGQLQHLGNNELSELVYAMLSFAARERPDAREVSRTCLELAPHVPGPWLRDWAEREVPRARGRRAMDDGDPLVDAMLGESEGDDDGLTGILPAVPEPGVLRGTRLVVLITVAAMAALTLWAVSAARTLREADDRTGGRVYSAPVVEPQASPTPAAQPEPQPTTASAVPSPPTTAPASAAAASPTPQPAPAPARAQEPATVTIQGDAQEVYLIGNGRRYGAGQVPAGSYLVEARFEGRGLVEAGRAEIEAGGKVTLTCDSGFALCKAQ